MYKYAMERDQRIALAAINERLTRENMNARIIIAQMKMTSDWRNARVVMETNQKLRVQNLDLRNKLADQKCLDSDVEEGDLANLFAPEDIDLIVAPKK